MANAKTKKVVKGKSKAQPKPKAKQPIVALALVHGAHIHGVVLVPQPTEKEMHALRDLAEYHCQDIVEVDVQHADGYKAVEAWIEAKNPEDADGCAMTDDDSDDDEEDD